MKPVYILLLLSYNLSVAQIYEIGIFGGGSNFIGDVGETTFIAPNELSTISNHACIRLFFELWRSRDYACHK